MSLSKMSASLNKMSSDNKTKGHLTPEKRIISDTNMESLVGIHHLTTSPQKGMEGNEKRIHQKIN